MTEFEFARLSYFEALWWMRNFEEIIKSLINVFHFPKKRTHVELEFQNLPAGK